MNDCLLHRLNTLIGIKVTWDLGDNEWASSSNVHVHQILNTCTYDISVCVPQY